MLQPGKYPAKVKNYAVQPVKTGENKGDPAPTIIFEVKVGDSSEIVFWQGSFKEGPAREISNKALGFCGCTTDNFPMFPLGPEGGCLDLNREVMIDVIHEVKQKFDKYNNPVMLNGQPEMVTYAKVKWVNSLGGFQNVMSATDFKFHMSRMGLQGSFAQTAQQYGFDKKEVKAKPMETYDDVPF